MYETKQTPWKSIGKSTEMNKKTMNIYEDKYENMFKSMEIRENQSNSIEDPKKTNEHRWESTENQ